MLCCVELCCADLCCVVHFHLTGTAGSTAAPAAPAPSWQPPPTCRALQRMLLGGGLMQPGKDAALTVYLPSGQILSKAVIRGGQEGMRLPGPAQGQAQGQAAGRARCQAKGCVRGRSALCEQLREYHDVMCVCAYWSGCGNKG